MDRRPKADRPFEALRRRIERLVREAPAGETRVNLSARVNRSVVMNSGQAGSAQAASSRQTVRIHQDGMGMSGDEPSVNRKDARSKEA